MATLKQIIEQPSALKRALDGEGTLAYLLEGLQDV